MIYVIGIGPGSLDDMTKRAIKAIEESTHIVGYKTYIRLIEPLIEGKTIVQNGMRGEVERCKEAIALSRAGHTVAVISSGDAGVYGMAGLIYELANDDDDIRIVPGVTASTASAAILGAPLMHDFCHISLSDLLTPYDVIMNRVDMAAKGDFVICFYNPKSHGRPHHIEEAIKRIRAASGDQLMVGVVKDAGRADEEKFVFPIHNIDYGVIDMTSMVIVGNRATYAENGCLITPRGYKL